jgi:hypothetical protein
MLASYIHSSLFSISISISIKLEGEHFSQFSNRAAESIAAERYIHYPPMYWKHKLPISILESGVTTYTCIFILAIHVCKSRANLAQTKHTSTLVGKNEHYSSNFHVTCVRVFNESMGCLPCFFFFIPNSRSRKNILF